MSAAMEYNERGLREALLAIKRLEGLARDMKPVFEDIGESLVQSVEERFRRQRDPEDKSWTPLAKSTLKRKKNRRILTESTNLRRRIVYRAARHRVEVGTNVVYASTHQFGSTREVAARSRLLMFKVDKSGRSRFARRSKANLAQWVGVGAHRIEIPARPFLGISDEDAHEIRTIIAEHFEGVMRLQ